MRILDLFSGIGGFSVAGHQLGWVTEAFVERDGFCQAVLREMKISVQHSEAARANLVIARATFPVVEKVAKQCERCEVVMKLAPSVARTRRFCSRECRYITMVGDAAPNSGGGSWMRGENNPNWKDGQASERRKRHGLAEQQQWRRRVFQRDGYICQRCGLNPKTRNQLRAHHIAPWALFPTLRFDLSNGVTICRECHDWIHSAENTQGEFLRCA